MIDVPRRRSALVGPREHAYRDTDDALGGDVLVEVFGRARTDGRSSGETPRPAPPSPLARASRITSRMQSSDCIVGSLVLLGKHYTGPRKSLNRD